MSNNNNILINFLNNLIKKLKNNNLQNDEKMRLINYYMSNCLNYDDIDKDMKYFTFGYYYLKILNNNNTDKVSN